VGASGARIRNIIFINKLLITGKVIKEFLYNNVTFLINIYLGGKILK